MNVFEKINAVRMAILNETLTKDKKAFNYNYIDLPQIEPIITKECNSVRLLTLVDFPQGVATMRIFDMEKPKEDGSPDLIVTAPCDYTLVEIKGSQPIQKVGGMLTYMRRYLYMQVFAISEHDAVEGIGNLSQETANNKSETPKAEKKTESKTEQETDPKRKKLLEDFEKNLPDYLSQLVAYKKVNSVDDFDTDYLEGVYKKKMATVKPAQEKTDADNL